MEMSSSQKPPSGATHRVVITGAGIITSMGTGWQANAQGFREGRQALKPITVFDPSAQRVHRGGEVEFEGSLPENRLTKRQVARMDRASRLLVHAGSEAMQQAGWSAAGLDKGSIPICLGTSAGAMAIGETYYETKSGSPAYKRGLAEKVVLYQPHTQAQLLADALGVQGPLTIVTNACASGANSIGHIFHLIKQGRAERGIAGGYDALAKMVFSGFDSLQALSTTLPRPFDQHRDGLALGEGAAIVTLERYEDAVARGADIIAEVVGYGASTDLHHLTQPHPQGDAALVSMTQACAEAGVTAKEVQYINSHGTGTPLNDVAEGMAIQRWAGEDVGQVMVSSTKGNIGHLLGGAGAVEAVICLLAMREGFVPPTMTIETLDSICTFDLVREPRDATLDCVLTNSFGFGGSNATLIMKRGDLGAKESTPAKSEPVPCVITGWGAVSPAGWSAAQMQEALLARKPLPTTTEQRSEDAPVCQVRKVPAMTQIPDWMKQPRFRRTTTAGRHAVHAAAEALGPEKLALSRSGDLKVGVIFCTMNGCVQFSRRFYAEVLKTPLLASPILFPETVYNAPSSHISALLGSREMNYSLVGDSAQFVSGMKMACQWLQDHLVDACVVVAAEEHDWLSDEALILFNHAGVGAEGAAAVLIEREGPGTGGGIRIPYITEPVTFANTLTREEAAARVKDELVKVAAPNALLCNSLGAGPRADRAEQAAWAGWTGDALSVRDVLGEGFGATSGWQTVAACEAIKAGLCEQAIVSATGLSQQAVGAVLAR